MGDARRRKQLGLMPTVHPFEADMDTSGNVTLNQGPQEAALQVLIESEKRATENGVTFWLAALNPGVLEAVRNSGLDQKLGRERMLFNARLAIERYQAMQAAGGGAIAAAAQRPTVPG